MKFRLQRSLVNKRILVKRTLQTFYYKVELKLLRRLVYQKTLNYIAENLQLKLPSSYDIVLMTFFTILYILNTDRNIVSCSATTTTPKILQKYHGGYLAGHSLGSTVCQSRSHRKENKDNCFNLLFQHPFQTVRVAILCNHLLLLEESDIQQYFKIYLQNCLQFFPLQTKKQNTLPVDQLKR